MWVRGDGALCVLIVVGELSARGGACWGKVMVVARMI